MIIDGHVYLFEPPDSSRGYADSAEHLKWVQAAYAWHHQPALRLRDRQRGPSSFLAPEGCTVLGELPDKNFRFDKAAGRALWEHEGETYTKYYYPPNLRNGEYTPASLISEMDYADVDMALIHTDPMLVRDGAFLAECVAQYPERLRSMAPVDEWRIRDEPDAVIHELETAIRTHGLHAIKFIPFTYLLSPEPWDDGTYRPFWEAATSLGVPVFFTLGTGPGEVAGGQSIEDQRRGYVNELRVVMRWMGRYPDTVCGLTHGFPWRVFLEGNRICLPDEIWEPFQNPNCSLEVCFPIRIGDLFGFPYREVWPTLAEMVEHIGADQLFWGTDMPFQNRFCTYRQSRVWIEKHCDSLAEQDRAAIMGGTLQRILGLE